MRWPWCSIAWRDAYERERAEVQRLTDALIRLERTREGLPEVPQEKRKPQEPVPADIQAMVEAMWSADHARGAEMRRARQLYAVHKDWTVVKGILVEPLAEEPHVEG